MRHQFADEPLLNEATIEELWELDAGSGFMQELVSEFNLQNRQLMAEISRFSDECEYEKLRFSIHTLKGSSLNIGAFRQGAVALAVENACKAKDCNSIRQLMPALTKIAQQTEEALKDLL